LLTQHS